MNRTNLLFITLSKNQHVNQNKQKHWKQKHRMKKFSIEKLGSVRERLGSWEVSNHVPVQSPGLWLTTSTCGVPHLTPETFELSGLQEHFAGVLVSYEKQARSIDIYEAYKKGFADFCQFKNFPTLLTVKDPMLTEKSGYSTFKNISVWGENNQRCVIKGEAVLFFIY